MQRPEFRKYFEKLKELRKYITEKRKAYAEKKAFRETAMMAEHLMVPNIRLRECLNRHGLEGTRQILGELRELAMSGAVDASQIRAMLQHNSLEQVLQMVAQQAEQQEAMQRAAA